MAKDIPEPSHYDGHYKGHRLTITEAKERNEKALAELFNKDAVRLTLEVSEECKTAHTSVLGDGYTYMKRMT